MGSARTSSNDFSEDALQGPSCGMKMTVVLESGIVTMNGFATTSMIPHDAA
ncbi:hypothetical protein LCGC14_1698360 [marine sediment metagenome]|uniref:Uncharacterized protein n=1 Tax=marine sediment metagenome TaxID=412755 RepID=A0A0F9KIQ5_9ZZZZ